MSKTAPKNIIWKNIPEQSRESILSVQEKHPELKTATQVVERCLNSHITITRELVISRENHKHVADQRDIVIGQFIELGSLIKDRNSLNDRINNMISNFRPDFSLEKENDIEMY